MLILFAPAIVTSTAQANFAFLSTFNINLLAFFHEWIGYGTHYQFCFSINLQDVYHECCSLIENTLLFNWCAVAGVRLRNGDDFLFFQSGGIFLRLNDGHLPRFINFKKNWKYWKNNARAYTLILNANLIRSKFW